MGNVDLNAIFSIERKEEYEKEAEKCKIKVKNCEDLLQKSGSFLSLTDRTSLSGSIESFLHSSDIFYYRAQCCMYHSCNHVWAKKKSKELDSRNYMCMKCGFVPFGQFGVTDTQVQDKQKPTYASKYYMKVCGRSTEEAISEYISRYPLRAEKAVTEKAMVKIYKSIISEKPDISDEELLEEYNKKSNDPTFYQEKVVRRRTFRNW